MQERRSKQPRSDVLRLVVAILGWLLLRLLHQALCG